MSKRWAFVGLTLLSAFSVLRCGSSSVLPPLETTGGDDSGTGGPGPGVDSGQPHPQDANPTTQDSPVTPPQDHFVPPVDAGTPAMTVSATTLDFGLVPCGTTANRKLVTLTNTGTAILTVTGNFSLNGGVAFTADFEAFGGSPPDAGASDIVLNPGDKASLSIQPKQVATSTATLTTANFFADTFTLSTVPAITGTGANPQIAVTETPQGAIFGFTPTGAAFGGVTVNTPATRTFVINNTGNLLANVQLQQELGDAGAGSGPFQVSTLGPFAITAGGATPSITATYTPIDTTASNGLLALTNVVGPLCQPLPNPYTLSGFGSEGLVAVNTTPLSFGNAGFVACGTQATDQKIPIQNNGNAPFDYTAVVNVGSAYYSLGSAKGTVNPGQTVYVDVQPNPIPASIPTANIASDFYQGSVNITTNAPNDSAHIIPLHMTAQGVILTSTFGGQTLPFGNVPLGNSPSNSFNVNNLGNQTADVTFFNGNAAFQLQTTSNVVPPNQPISVTATFSPQKVQPYVDVANMTVAPGTVLCAPLPGVVTMTGTGTPAPPLGISVSQPSVPFGQVPCNTTPNPFSFAINNTGAVAFNWTSSFTGSRYVLTPSSGSIAANGSPQTVSVSMPGGVPFPGNTLADFYDDLLTIQAQGGPSIATVTVPIKLTAKGAIFNFAPSSVNFGSVPLSGAAATAPFSLVNTGNAATEVDIQVNDSAASTSVIARAPLNPVTVQPNVPSPLTATFKANDTNTQTATFHMVETSNPTNTLCAPLPPDMTLSGTGTTATALVSPTSISFGTIGLVPCGTQAGAQTITISNSGNGPFNWTAALTAGGAFYSISPSSGSVPAASGPGSPGTQTIQVTPQPIPSQSAVTADLYAGAVTVTDLGGGPTHVVSLHMTAQGAILSSSLSGQTLDFGSLPVGQSSAQQFSVTNNGNAPANISFNDGTPAIFAIVSPSSVGAQQSVGPNVTFTPLATQPYTDTAIMTVSSSTTVLCAPLPANVTLKGKGVPVAPPAFTTTAPSITFGNVPCGAVGTAQPISITNTGTNTFQLTATLRNGAGSLFSVNAPANVAPQSQQPITVTMKAMSQTASVAPDFYADVLTLSASTQGGTVTSDIPVHVTAQGAILSISPTAIDFGSVPQSQTSNTPFKIVNSGNAAAEVDLAVVDGVGSASTITRSPLGPVTVAGNGSQPLTATFVANDTNPQTATLKMVPTSNPNNVFCQALPLPGPMTLQGTGTNGTAFVSPAAISFGPNGDGLVDCNTAALEQPITITNTGNAPITWQATPPPGATYSLSPSSGSVPAQVGSTPGTAFFNVIPAKIPATSAVTPDLYAGAVTITTSAAGDSAHLVQLHMTAHGAILSSPVAGQTLAFGSETVNTTATEQFSVTNNGNASATLSLSNGNAAFTFTPKTSFAVNGSQSVSLTGQFTPTKTGPFNDSAIFQVDPSTPMCGVTPANIALSGTGVAVSAPVLSLSAASLVFGNVPCGTAGQPQTFSIDNKGAAPFTVAFTFRNGASSLFTAAPISGQIGAGAQQTGSVSMASPVPSTASISPDFYADVLSVTATNPGGSVTQDLPVHITAQGAIMILQPTKLDFGTVPIGATPTLPFNIVNQGNLAAEVDVVASNGAGSSSSFARAPLGPQTVSAAASKAMTATFDAVDSIAQAGTFTLVDTHAPGNVFCAPMPPPVMTLVGTGTSVTSTVSPGAIDFQNTLCGQQAAQKTVTITNNASTLITWSATVTNGQTFYGISPTGTQNLGGNAQATLTITPVAIPHTASVAPNFFAGTVTITTSAPNDQPHVIQLSQTAQGVILTSTVNAIGFGGVAVNQSPAATQQFTITNTGNLPVSGITLQNANPVFAVNPSDLSSPRTLNLPSLAPNAFTVPVFSFSPSSAAPFVDTAAFTIPGNVVLCAPAPANIALSGSGTTGIAVSPSTLNFGLVQCPAAIVTDAGTQEGPAQQASPQQVTITNQGGASTFAVTLGLGSSSPYTITDINNVPLTLGANNALPSGQTKIIVVPHAIQRPATTSNDGFADTLTVTTAVANDTAHNIGLHQTAQGAVLTYSPSAIASFDSNPQHVTFQNFTLLNNGNYPVSYVVSSATTKSNLPGGQNFIINLPAPNSLQQLFAGANLNGVLQSETNSQVGCPAACTVPQALGTIFVQPVDGSILCSDPPPIMPVSSN